MLSHILKTELSALKKNFIHSFTNVLGLVLGSAATFLIFLYVISETSYDKHFADAERIYRVGAEYTFDDKVDLFSNIARPVAKALADDYPEVEAQTRLVGVNGLFTHSGLLSIGETIIKSDQIFYGDSTYFEVFNQPFVEGDPSTALTQPNSIVLSKDLAQRLFNDESALNKTIRLDDQIDLRITGIIEPSSSPTHMPLEALVSWQNGARPGEEGRWLGWHVYTYVKLSSDINEEAFEAKLPDFYDRRMKAQFEQFGGAAKVFVQPLTDIHLTSDLQWEAYPNGSLNNVYIFSIVGLLIVLLVSINHTNLISAKAVQRTREVGIRKVLGSNRKSIMSHMMVSSLIMALVSAIISAIVVVLALPAFGQMSGIETDQLLLLEGGNILFFLSIFVFVGLLSGIYPAMHGAGLKPTQVLNNRSSGAAKKSYVRKVLVGIQFIIAAGLLFATSIVLKQTSYILNRDLGFDKESTMAISVNDTAIQNRMSFIKSEWLKNPAIAEIGTAENIPTEALVQVLAEIKEIDGSYNSIGAEYMPVDYEFPQMLGLELVTGRYFDREFGNDADTKVLVNETAAKLYGGNEAAIGREVCVATDDDGNRIDSEIIGVIKDFHTISLHSLIQPIILVVSETPLKMVVKLKTDDLKSGVDFITAEWDKLNSSFPLEYTFLDDGFKSLHKSETNLQRLLIYFCFLIVIISCLGLLSLVAYTSRTRLREVTIRKVMGSTNQGIFKLLMKDYLLPILLSLIVAIPVSWMLMDNWLNNFSYRTDIDMLRVAMVVLLTMVIAFVTVSFHTNKISRHNPVDSLRHE